MLEWLLVFLLLVAVLALFYQYSKLRGQVESRATQLFNEWRERAEKAIREDAVRRSLSTTIGRVGEQLAPVLIFQRYGISPKDLRFIGTPVDFVAFKGLSEGRVEEVCFIEVKSGESPSLSEREKLIKDAIESKKVGWLLIHLPSELKELRS
jgi:predicted Holliday junction resolvase-like endonuclease